PPGSLSHSPQNAPSASKTRATRSISASRLVSSAVIVGALLDVVGASAEPSTEPLCVFPVLYAARRLPQRLRLPLGLLGGEPTVELGLGPLVVPPRVLVGCVAHSGTTLEGAADAAVAHLLCGGGVLTHA